MSGTCLRSLALVLALSACTHEIPRPPECRNPAPLAEPLPLVSVAGASGVILPVTRAPRVFCQCSRRTPGPGDDYYIPSIEQISALERDLPAFVLAQTTFWLPNPKLDRYKRQYVGVIRGGRKMIYVNLFSDSSPRDSAESAYWRRNVIIVCDGGSSYLGVEYDVQTGQFTHIAENGIS
jgi:hypothetical protein